MSEAMRQWAENLVDELRIAEVVAARDATDTGERVSLDEFLAEFAPDLLDDADA